MSNRAHKSLVSAVEDVVRSLWNGAMVRRRRPAVLAPQPAEIQILEPRQMLAAIMWSGSGDGVSWGDRYNWAGRNVPGSGDDVTIDVSGSDAIHISSGGYSVHSLQAYNSITLDGGSLSIGASDSESYLSSACALSVTSSSSTLTLGGVWRNNGAISTSAGTANLNGSWTNTGTLEDLGGAMNLGGNWSNAGGQFAVSGGTVNLGGSFTTAGLGSWSRTGGTVNLTGTLNNVGQTLSLSASALGPLGMQNGSIIQGGEIVSVDGAGLTVQGVGELDGVTRLSAPVTVNMNSSLTVLGGLELNNTITLTSVGGNWWEQSRLTLQGMQTLSGTGQVLMEDNRSWVVAAGTSDANPAVVTIGPGITIRGQGCIEKACANDRVVNRGTILADTAGTLTINAKLENANTVRVTSGSLTINNMVSNSSVLEATGGSLSIGGVSWTSASAGTIRAVGGTLGLYGNWSNSGSIQATGGTVNLGSSMTTAGLGAMSTSGTIVNLFGILDNTNSVLQLGAVGPLNLCNGSAIQGGQIVSSNGAGLTVVGSSTLGGGVQISAPVTINNGVTLTVRDGLTLNSTMAVGGDGTTVVDFVGSQSLSGTGQVALMTNHDHQNMWGNRWNESSWVRVSGTAQSPAELTIGAGVTIHGAGQIGGNSGTVVNQGTIRGDRNEPLGICAGGTNTATGVIGVQNGGSVELAGAWTNAGTVAVDGGTLGLHGTWSNSGSIQVNGGTLNLIGNLSSSCLGRITGTGGTLSVSGILDNTNAALDLGQNGSDWIIQGGQIRGGIIASTECSPLRMGGDLVLDAVELHGTILWAAGSTLHVRNGLRLNGTLMAEGGNHQLRFEDSQEVTGSGCIDISQCSWNPGWSWGYWMYNTVNVVGTNSSPALVEIGSGIEILGQGTIAAANASLRNDGEIRATVPGGILSIAADVRNTGHISAVAGTLAFSGQLTNTGTTHVTGASLLISGPLTNQGTLDVSNGGTVVASGQSANSGTINVDNGNLTTAGLVSNTGTIRVSAGVVSLGGNGLTSTGQLEVDGGELDLVGTWRSPGAILQTAGLVNIMGTVSTPVSNVWMYAGGTTLLTGTLDNRNSTVDISAMLGHLELAGGTIEGGTVISSSGVPLTGYGTLEGSDENADGQPEPLHMAADFQISSARELVIKNGLDLSGMISVPNGTITIGGVFISYWVYNNTSLKFVGPQRISGSGSISLVGPLSQVAVDGTVDLQGVKISGNGGILGDGSATLVNHTMIETNQNISISGVSFENYGTVKADRGTISIADSFVNHGQLVVVGSGVISLPDRSVSGAMKSWGSDVAAYMSGQTQPGVLQVVLSTAGGTTVAAGTVQQFGSTTLITDIPHDQPYTCHFVHTHADGSSEIFEDNVTPQSNGQDAAGFYGLSAALMYSNGGCDTPSLSSYQAPAYGFNWQLPSAPIYATSPQGAVAAAFCVLIRGNLAGMSVVTTASPQMAAMSTAGSGSTAASGLASLLDPDGGFAISHVWWKTSWNTYGDYNLVNQDYWVIGDARTPIGQLWQTYPRVDVYKIKLSLIPGMFPAALGAFLGAIAKSIDPVRYYDGAIDYTTPDLAGDHLSLARSYTQYTQLCGDRTLGAGMMNASIPSLIGLNGEEDIAVSVSGTSTILFHWNGSAFIPTTNTTDQLLRTPNGYFTYISASGEQIRFYDFSASNGNLAGKFISDTDVAGNCTYVSGWTGAGSIAEVSWRPVGQTDALESMEYSYLPNGDPNAGLVSSVTLRHLNADGTWRAVRSVAYSYYTNESSNGLVNHLKSAVIQDASGQAIDTKYYRYYTNRIEISAPQGDGQSYRAPMFTGLKYVFDARSFSRLSEYAASLGVSVDQLSDSQVASFATHYFEYDQYRRCTRHDVQGFGGDASSTTGIGESTYAYTVNASPAADVVTNPSEWMYKTTETLPDGNRNVVYTNYIGEVILKVFQDVSDPANPSLQGLQWGDFYKYDSSGRLLWHAKPSAVNLPSDLSTLEQYPDLLHNVNGNYQYLNDSAGEIDITDYYGTTSPTISETVAGGVAGYERATKVQNGELGSPILLSSEDYFARSANGSTIYPTAHATVYPTGTTSGARTTDYSYTWYANSLQAQTITTTLPAVSTAQNGSGVATTQVSFYDSYGELTWFKDAAGCLDYYAYDLSTGAVIKQIEDADTTKFASLPIDPTTGLPVVTPSGGGLHLVTTMAVDDLGRTTQLTDPAGHITYTVYKDAAHEVRVYSGWDPVNHTTTGPIAVAREDRAGNYDETLTFSGTPHLTNGAPDGTEAIPDVQSLSRDYYNNADQIIRTNAYFSLAGLTYSTAPNLGALGVNYYSTSFGYDVNGNQYRTVSATGTITEKRRDALGRIASVWVGTNSSNLVETKVKEYDNGGVGDGNLTKKTFFPGAGQPDRVTVNLYDWRNRLVSSKSGVRDDEGDVANRALTVFTYDNLNEITRTDTYDGDTLLMTDANADGIPDSLPGSRLRARSESSYDALGRVFQSRTYGVDQSSGAVGSSLSSDLWYDPRGYVIKTLSPSGLVSKMTYDGAGRLAATYQSDGGGDASYADAGNVDGDTVLQQVEYTLDGDGNVLLTTTKERFHNASGTGALGNPTSTAQPQARVSYAASYYDLGGRLTANVDVGTNGGMAYTRPTSAPDRSDTVLVTSYGYNPAGLLESVTDPKNIVGKTYYDALGRTTKTVAAYTDGIVTDSSNQTTEYTYDGAGHILTKTVVLPNNAFQTTRYIYGVSQAAGSGIDSNDLLIAVQYPDPLTGQPSASYQESYAYDALGEVIATTHANGAVDVTTYNRLGRVRLRQTLTTDGSGNPLTQYHYNVFGELIDQTDPRGAVTQYEYDSFGRLAQTTQPDPDGTGPQSAPITQYQYDNAGRVTQVTDPTGAVTVCQYDLLGRKTQTLLPDPATGGQTANSPVSIYAYNLNGDADTVTDALGHTTQTTYDGFGRVAQVTQPDPDGSGPLTAATTSYAYDRDGHVTDVTDPLGHTTLSQYDNLGRKTQVSTPDPDGTGPLAPSTTTYQYDASNNLLATTDPLGQTTHYTYDAQNHQTAVIAPSPDGVQARPTTSSTYTVMGQTHTVTDPSGNTTTYAYNQLGEQVTQTNTLGKSRTLQYDLAGNLTQTIDRNGRVRVFAYDALGRMTAERWIDAGGATIRTISYAYDDKGRLTSVSDPDSSYSYTYDNLDRVLTIDNLGTPNMPHVVLTLAYDANGNRTSVSSSINGSSDFTNAYLYDALNRLTELTQTGTGIAAKRVDYSYTDNGLSYQIKRYADLAGLVGAGTTTYGYDQSDRLTSLTHVRGLTTIAAYTWAFDSAGRITNSTSPDGNTAYAYDANGQLLSADNSARPDEAYQYDLNGNRTMAGYQTGADNRLLSDGTYNYTYDDEGNRLTATSIASGEVTRYTWDSRNRLTDVTYETSTGTVTKRVHYTYDINDLRIAKQVDSNADGIYETTERCVYDGKNIVLVLDGTGAVTGRYLQGPGLDQTLAEELPGKAVRWLLPDNEGSIRDVVETPTSLDTSLDGTGQLILPNLGMGQDSARATVVLPDGKILVAGDSTQTGFSVVRLNSNGTVDTAFGTQGKTYVAISANMVSATGMAVQVDGKILVVGVYGRGLKGAIVRLNSDGTLDTSFSNTSIVTGGPFNAVAVQADGKIVTVGKSGTDFAVTRYNANGSLDTTFNGTGKVTTDLGATDVAYAVAIQSDGMIVVAGQTGTDVGIVRYTSSGALDTTFNSTGKKVVDIGATDIAWSLAIQRDGKILVAGSSGTYSNTASFAAIRLTASGALDSAFNGTGIVVTAPMVGGYGSAYAVIVQSDGKIVLAGEAIAQNSNLISDFAVIRYTADGMLDTSFNGTGVVTTDLGGTDAAYAAAVDASGRLLVVGRGGNQDFAAVRYGSDGAKDTTFGGGGEVFVDCARGQDSVRATVVQPDGKTIVATATVLGFLAERLNVDGTPDTTFGINGTTLLTIRPPYCSDSLASVNALFLQPDGKVVVVGATAGPFSNAAAFRLNSDGTFDTYLQTVDSPLPVQLGKTLNAIAQQQDGKLLLAGTTVPGGASNVASCFMLVRYTSDGLIDPAFAGGWRVATILGTSAIPHAMAIQPDGKIVVGGESDGNSAVVRYNADGTLDTTFNGTGFVITDLGNSDVTYGLALQSDGKIVVTGVSGNSNFLTGQIIGNIAIARYNADGTLDTTFNGTGKLIVNTGSTSSGQSVFVQDDGKIVIAGSANSDFVLLRLSTDGTLDTTFGTAGIWRIDLGGADAADSAARGFGGTLTVAGTSGLNRAIVRAFLGDGSEHLVYDSFGQIVSQTGTLGTPRFTYTGREWDADAGLFYNRARWYDPATGRFISQDPIGFAAGDTNLYRYVANDPVNYVDPSGLAATGTVTVPGAPWTAAGEPIDIPPINVGAGAGAETAAGGAGAEAAAQGAVAVGTYGGTTGVYGGVGTVAGGAAVAGAAAVGAGIGAGIYYSGAGSYIGTTQAGNGIGNWVVPRYSVAPSNGCVGYRSDGFPIGADGQLVAPTGAQAAALLRQLQAQKAAVDAAKEALDSQKEPPCWMEDWLGTPDWMNPPDWMSDPWDDPSAELAPGTGPDAPDGPVNPDYPWWNPQWSNDAQGTPDADQPQGPPAPSTATAPTTQPSEDTLRPKVNTGLSDRVTKGLREGEMRTPEEVAQARNFFERNRELAEKWWSDRDGGSSWPENTTHAEHPRPLKNGGDPLYIEPGFGGPNAPHMIPGPDGLTDSQRWGRLGGRPKGSQ